MKPLLALCLALGIPTACHAELERAAFIGLSASVLKIEALRTQGGYSLGSGVVVRANKVVTNCHVTRDAAEIHVQRGGVRWRVVSQAVDADHDLCVLYTPGVQAAVVQMGSSARVRVGQQVNALGYTGGLEMQNSPGDVVALHRHDNGLVIQSTNWFNSGASGGGLFDDDLRLVGILTYRLRGGAVHYFAAPVEWLMPMIDDDKRFVPVQPIPASALAYWQMPVALQPNFLRAALLERDSNWTELETLSAQWLRSDAEDAEPWYLHGMALEKLNRLPDAQSALERSVKIEPAFGDAWFRLGLLYTRLGQADLARSVLSRLYNLKSDLARTLAVAIDKL
jgi:serine protease Do